MASVTPFLRGGFSPGHPQAGLYQGTAVALAPFLLELLRQVRRLALVRRFKTILAGYLADVFISILIGGTLFASKWSRK
jgi:hypothetical protein